MHAQTVEAAQWWARPRGAQAADWIANYQNSLQARHRSIIAGIVKALNPATLLEVGCHCGPNLIRLTAELPTLFASGVDANADAIAAGEAWAVRAGVSDRVELCTGLVPEATAGLKDGCVDVVLSCYSLAYIAPRDLDAVLYEIGRLATKAVVLAEPMVATGPATEARSLSGYTEWAHAYADAVRWVGSLRGMQTRIVPITPPVDRLNGVWVATR